MQEKTPQSTPTVRFLGSVAGLPRRRFGPRQLGSSSLSPAAVRAERILAIGAGIKPIFRPGSIRSARYIEWPKSANLSGSHDEEPAFDQIPPVGGVLLLLRARHHPRSVQHRPAQHLQSGIRGYPRPMAAEHPRAR